MNWCQPFLEVRITNYSILKARSRDGRTFDGEGADEFHEVITKVEDLDQAISLVGLQCLGRLAEIRWCPAGVLDGTSHQN